MSKKEYSLQLGEEKITLRFLNWAERANASALATSGETVVLATAVMGEQDVTLPYFPLMVEYRENYWAAGKIGGGRFHKREGRPSDDAVLKARLIDRTLRPLFNHNMRREVQVVNTVLSYDQKNSPDLLALVASSAALATSNIPWNGPAGGVRVVKTEKGWVVNPSTDQMQTSDVEIILAGAGDKINMIETEANQYAEKDLIEGVQFGHKYVKELIDFQNKIVKEIGAEKEKVALREAPDELKQEVRNYIESDLRKIILDGSDTEGEATIYDIRDKLQEHIAEKFAENEDYTELSSKYFEDLVDKLIHEAALKHGKRVDGRKFDQIRNLSAEVGVLPRPHGSGIFMRGLTHALSTVTLDSPGEEELVDAMEGESKRRFMHHYNFPPYSTGEPGFFRGPGRREIGHGALAEKALRPVIPPLEKFPYVIRAVTEAVSSNGSTSMASVCGSSLALMDAGVPIEEHIAGIAMGLMSDGKDAKILTDIQGPEDHWGDMDFKVAGTKNGVTAIQLDVKIDGLTIDLIAKVLEDAKKARLQIIEVMEKAISKPRDKVSKYAPIIEFIEIKPDQIALLIGSGGRTIKEIMAKTNTEIDVEDDGKVYFSGKNRQDIAQAKEMAEAITHEVEVGDVYDAKVVRITDFGAFVELVRGQEALVHVSELSDGFTKNVQDVVKVGDTIKVKVIRIDEMGKIAASAKQAKQDAHQGDSRQPKS